MHTRRIGLTAVTLVALTLAFALRPAPVAAQKGGVNSVAISVDKHLVGLGEQVEVTVEIVVHGQANYEQYIQPSFQHFRVIAGGMTTQNIQMINWQVRRSEAHVHTVAPQKKGALKIGPAAIRIGGRLVKSNAVTVQVKDGVAAGAPKAPTPNPNPGPTADADADKLLPAGQPPPSVFLHASATPQKVYVGQQVVALWRLFTQRDIYGYQPTKQPTTDNFWSEDLQSPNRLEYVQQQIQGRRYFAAVIARRALFAQKPGKLTIGSLAARIRTEGSFGMGAPQERASPAVEVEVMPLPTDGRPAGFSEQNVGQFDIAASVDRNRVKAGDATTLEVVIRGAGNLRQLKMTPLGAIDGIKVYQPKITDRIQLRDAVRGEKRLQYLLLPTRAGRLTVPPLRVDYFDPARASYLSASTAPIAITAVGSFAQQRVGKGTKANVLSRDIRPPRTGSIRHRGAFDFFGGLSLWLFALPLGFVVGIGAVERVRARLSKQTERSLSRAASRRIRRRLRKASSLRDDEDPAAFFGELAGVLADQLQRTIHVNTDGLTREELRAAMTRAGVDAELVTAAIAELDNCDFARFAPSASDAEQRGEALARTRRLISQLASTRVAATPASA